MKIVIEKIGDNVGVSFIGKGHEQLQQAADGFANSVKSAVIARYKMKPSERKEEFTGKEAAFLSKLFNL